MKYNGYNDNASLLKDIEYRLDIIIYKAQGDPGIVEEAQEIMDILESSLNMQEELTD